jgi:hypothetical protein
MCATNDESAGRCGACNSILDWLGKLAREYQNWSIEDKAAFHGETVEAFTKRMANSEN